MNMKNANAGFTLVEVLITGIILSVIAGAVLAIVNVFLGEVNDGTVMSTLQTDYDIVSSQIGSQARVAKYVLAQGETTPVNAAANPVAIHMVLANGSDSVGYLIDNDGFLKVATHNTGTFLPFIIGRDSIRVTNTSSFTLPAGRKSVGLNLTLWTVYKNRQDTLTIPGDTYQCRN